MTVIYEQPPSGGCECCGGEVRSRKGGFWLCQACYRELGKAAPTCSQCDASHDRASCPYQTIGA